MTAPLSNDRSVIPDNRLKTYNGTTYYYDELGNLIHRELADGEVQNYFYDLHDQLVKAEIFKKDGTKETWSYTYDALGRRIGKGRLKYLFRNNLSQNRLRIRPRRSADPTYQCAGPYFRLPLRQSPPPGRPHQ